MQHAPPWRGKMLKRLRRWARREYIMVLIEIRGPRDTEGHYWRAFK